MKKLLAVILISLISFFTFGQKKCASILNFYQNNTQNINENIKNNVNYWVKSKNKEEYFKYINLKKLNNENILTIPVIVHILHQGENIGIGSNISEAQIQSQIEALNEDFRRLNADASNTPLEFQPVAIDCKIEFKLAIRDPEGLPTSGINRILSNKSTWNPLSSDDDAKMKALSYWSSEDYFNIWVTTLSNDYLGYAQFPVSHELDGLEGAYYNGLTDGIVIDYRYFGSIDKGNFPYLQAPYDKGRTTTHEVGHFLGLRHVWGDGDCEYDDYCEDTPNANNSYLGCPTEGMSCNSNDMFQNYMDFTDDDCMNLFTICQKDRMRKVLESSPRRKSLLTSNALTPPIQVNNDMGVRAILSPQKSICTNTLSPEVVLRNYGTNDVQDVKVKVTLYKIENNIEIPLSENDTFIDGLSLGFVNHDYFIHTFDQILLTEEGTYKLVFEILETNGIVDGNNENNIQEVEFLLPTNAILPSIEKFEILNAQWAIINEDKNLTWEIANAPSEDENNQALTLKFYDYEELTAQDILVSPKFDLNDIREAKLKFKIAHATYNNLSNDGLIIAVTTDCNLNYNNEDIIYSKFGNQLATSDAQESFFIPKDRTEWRYETIDLTAYLGKENIQIIFIGINNYGNNLYLDDIEIDVKTQHTLDLEISKIVSPGTVNCLENVNPIIKVKNVGKTTIDNFTINYIIDDSFQNNISFNNLALEPYSSTNITLPEISLTEGQHILKVNSINPNNLDDENIENDTLSLPIIVSYQQTSMPMRETFDDPSSNQLWKVSNPDHLTSWSLIPLNIDNNVDYAYFIPLYNYNSIGQRDWLVSPLLDFSNQNEAKLYFEYSYTNNTNFTDSLKVLVSDNCGETYPHEVFSKSATNLAIASNNVYWIPTEKYHWKKDSVDLSSFIGKEDVRIAFVACNGYGNNLYINNIEINPPRFASNTFKAFPNPASDEINIAFNFLQKENVILAIYTTHGQLVYQKDYENIDKQILKIDTSIFGDGLYIIKIMGNQINLTQKILISN